MHTQRPIRRFALVIGLFSALALPSAVGWADSTPDDKAALAGLSEVKVAFDITAGDAKRLLAVLNVID